MVQGQRRNNRPSIMKHLDENGLSYWEHWWRAMKLSGALFIHAFLPDVLSDYASKELHNE